MRILQLTPGTGHFHRGACLRDNALVRGLVKRGHDAQLVPLYLPLVLDDDVPVVDERVHMGGINMHLQQRLPLLGRTPHWIADRFDDPDVLRWAASRGDMTDISLLGALTLSTLKGGDGRNKREVQKLVSWLAAQPPPDVCILSNVMLAGLARHLKERFDARVVCTLQGEAAFLDALPDEHRGACWDVLRERAADVDHFVPVSRWYGEQLTERLALDPARVTPVHNGIDTLGLIAIDREMGPPTIGYLARMCEAKGLPLLVDAFIEAHKRMPGARLRVAGVQLEADAELVRSLEATLARAGCASAVDFLPNLDWPGKIDFLASLDLFSVPATCGEAFGLYMLEAWGAAIPVVQPRHGAFPELIEKTGAGVLVEPDDPLALADALVELMRDEPRRKAMGALGRAAVLEHFTYDSMAAGVEAVCATVVSAEPTSAESPDAGPPVAG